MVRLALHPRLAAVLCALFLVLLASGFLWPPITVEFLVFSFMIALPFTVVGALIATKRPENPVGWLILGFGGVAALSGACDQYFVFGAVTHPGSLPATDFVVSLGIHTWHPGFALFILAFFLFPDGAPLSARWRLPVALTIIVGAVGVTVGMFEFEFQRTWDPQLGRVMQPLYDGGMRPVADIVFGLCIVAIVVLFAVSAIGLVVRLRRSRGVVRQQIKLVVFATVMTVTALVTSLFVVGNGAFGALMLPSIPVSIAVAVLRYRLFDIDRLIRRTLVYATVTVVLGGVYAGIVVGVGAVFGAEEDAPPVLVAAATIALATLFRPVRHRAQAIVDRRFNRRRYNAARTIEAFSTQLRNELDLDALSTALLATVHETMEPAEVTLWLRPPGKV